MTSIDAATTTTTPHLLRIADLTAVRLNALLDLAEEMQDGSTWWKAGFAGASLACLSDDPESRARETFVDAAHRLGMIPIVLGPQELQDTSLAELARSLTRTTRAIVVDSPSRATLEEIAGAAGVPVINARAGHALAVLLTVRRRFGYLDGLRLAYVGAGDDMAHALMEAGALAGMHVAIATPPGREPDHAVALDALRLASQHGGSLRLGHDPRAAVDLAHVVYADASAEALDEALKREADPGALFLDHLPAQTANRVPCAQATLHTLTRPRPM